MDTHVTILDSDDVNRYLDISRHITTITNNKAVCVKLNIAVPSSNRDAVAKQ